MIPCSDNTLTTRDRSSSPSGIVTIVLRFPSGRSKRAHPRQRGSPECARELVIARVDPSPAEEVVEDRRRGLVLPIDKPTDRVVGNGTP